MKRCAKRSLGPDEARDQTMAIQNQTVREAETKWETVGRSFAHRQLEEQAEETRHALTQAARAAREDDITATDLRRCYETLEDAKLVLDGIADAVDGFERPPRLEEVLDQDQIEQAFGD